MAKKNYNMDGANSAKASPSMAKPNEGVGKMDGGKGGGMGGMPGSKKNKDMNTYAKGGAVSAMPQKMSGKARGGGASTKGLDFKVV